MNHHRDLIFCSISFPRQTPVSTFNVCWPNEFIVRKISCLLYETKVNVSVCYHPPLLPRVLGRVPRMNKGAFPFFHRFWMVVPSKWYQYMSAPKSSCKRNLHEGYLIVWSEYTLPTQSYTKSRRRLVNSYRYAIWYNPSNDPVALFLRSDIRWTIISEFAAGGSPFFLWTWVTRFCLIRLLMLIHVSKDIHLVYSRRVFEHKS